LLLVVVLLLAGTAASLANPLFAGKLTELLLAETGAPRCRSALLAAWLLLLIVRAALSVGSSYLVGTRLMAPNCAAGFTSTCRSCRWPGTSNASGDILSLLSSDAESISRFVTNTVVQLLPQLLTLAFAFGMMAWLDPLIALVAALLLRAYTIVAKLLGRRIRPLSRAWIDSGRAWSPSSTRTSA
jgi:ABC-type multidrug transport system fused ATPase/permease subunit